MYKPIIKSLGMTAAALLAFVNASAAGSVPALKSARTTAVPEPTTVVGGIMTFNEEWGSTPEAGVYYIEVKPDGKITCQFKSEDMADVVSGLKKDNIMYTCEATSSYRYYYRQRNVSDWSTIGSRQEIDMEDVPADLTYDATLGKAYGSFWNENYGGFSFFGNFNLSTATWTSIDKAQRDERDIFALAADGKGTIYCLFGAYNYLATLDPTTGQVNRIKTTGFEIDTNWAEGRGSSMCYDAENDRLIATVAGNTGTRNNPKYVSVLYTINPHTGESVKVMDLPGNACFAGLYVVDNALDAEAPGEPTGLTVNLEGTATVGTVSFAMPTQTVGGAPLSNDNLTAIINLNGNETAIFNLKSGQKVTSPELTFVNGENTLRVTVADSERRGGSVSLTFNAGEDIPALVSDVKLAIVDGKALISWTAPTGGLNGGNINPDNLRYTIVRYPDATVVAQDAQGSSFTDPTITSALRTVWYTVAAHNSAGSSDAVESNHALVGGSMTVPFKEGFDNADDFALWTIENVNGGATWRYYSSDSEKAAEYQYDDEKLPADDWLISPPIRLESDKAYKLSYKWRVMLKAYPESFEIALGTSSNAASMTKPLARHAKVTNTGWQSADASLTVDSDGDYYIGIRCFSDGYMYILRVDDIEIVEIDNRVPAVIDDLQIIPGEQGARKATVKFTVPSKDNKGGELAEVTSATVSRNGKVIATLTDVAPGKAVSYEDTTVEADGMTSYAVSCANQTGSGVAAVAQAYIGVDAPGAVADLTISESDSHPLLSWKAPTYGVNGGWFDASAVTYRIVRSDGQVISEDCADTSFTDLTYTSPKTSQDAIWYLVTPYVGTTKGAYAQSELFLFGVPYSAPLTETFPKADMNYFPWITQSDNAVYYGWTLDEMGYNPSVSDQNGDRGLATFHSVGEPAGTVSYFYSPKVDISALANPTLSFYLYHAPGEGAETLDLEIAAGTDTFVPLEGATSIARTSAEGWTRYSYSLAPYKSADWIRIGFKGTGDAKADLYIDNVVIDSTVAVDLQLTALKAPATIAQGEQIKCSATVLNAGSDNVAAAQLKVTFGNALLPVALPALAAGAEATVEFEVEAAQPGLNELTATVEAEGDEVTANNSLSTSVNIVEARVNAPSNLAGTIDDNGTLTLSWNAPATDGTVTDDVESYRDWAINDIGLWTMWDGDYDITYMISNGLDYENATSPKAFQVCNAALLGIDIWDEGKPHSGDKMFMALCSYTYVNNDWLISPELNGKEQWISFYARSFTLQNTPAERMRVWYSTTDNDPANFTEITTSFVQLPGTWQEYRYFLPEGAKYFAINCVSDGAFAMFVDDISFNDLTVPTWELVKYEVYRDGEKIGETADTVYTQNDIDEGGNFSVKAIYDRGESPMSDSLLIAHSGLGFTAAANVAVEGHEGYVLVRNAAGSDYEIINPAGYAIARGTLTADAERINLASGVYIVRVADTTAKVIVR